MVFVSARAICSTTWNFSDWSEEEGLTSWFSMQAGIEIAKLFLAGGETVCLRATHLQILPSVFFFVHVESRGHMTS